MQEILIYGSGGFAREVAWLAEEIGLTVRGFVDDDPEKIGSVVNGYPVFGFPDAKSWIRDCGLVIAVGSPQTREKLYLKAAKEGFSFPNLIHPNVRLSGTVEVGQGTVITAGNILTVNIRLGIQVQINLDCTVGHDVILEDFATLAPGVHVSGWVTVERRAYIGTGAAIINGQAGRPLIIGQDAVVGAGAVVTRSVPPGTTVVGVPAKPIIKAQKER